LILLAWETPQTFTSSDYYNYDDLNRVENNTQYLNDLLESIGYSPTITGVNTSRDNTSLAYYDDLNRIEQNIQNLVDASYEPLTWETPKTTWVSVIDSFDYTDANRLENNLLNLKNMVDGIIEALLYCGDAQATICGKGNTLF
jgi:hypothetical protein